MSETRKCEACGHSAAHYDARFCLECGADCAATPPTPDRAAVRKAVVWVLSAANAGGMGERRMVNLCDALGINAYSTHAEIADALLAAVSRPAEARGEPTDAEVDAALKSLEVTHHWNTPTRERVRLALKCANQAAAPLPEPSGGEAR